MTLGGDEWRAHGGGFDLDLCLVVCGCGGDAIVCATPRGCGCWCCCLMSTAPIWRHAVCCVTQCLAGKRESLTQIGGLGAERNGARRHAAWKLGGGTINSMQQNSPAAVGHGVCYRG